MTTEQLREALRRFQYPNSVQGIELTDDHLDYIMSKVAEHTKFVIGENESPKMKHVQTGENQQRDFLRMEQRKRAGL